MNSCHKISPEDIQAYIDGELMAPNRSAIEEHIKSCSECRALAEELSRLERAVAEAECQEAPEEYFESFGSRVSAKIASKGRAPAGRSLWNLRGWPTVPLAAAAALALAITASRLMVTGPAPRDTVVGDEYASREIPKRQSAETKMDPEEAPASVKKSTGFTGRAARNAPAPGHPETASQPPSVAERSPDEIKNTAPSQAAAKAERETSCRDDGSAYMEELAGKPRPDPATLPRERVPMESHPRLLRTTRAILICLPSDRPDASPPEIGTVLEISLPRGG
jgi:anti-sigma factor RsiW